MRIYLKYIVVALKKIGKILCYFTSIAFILGVYWYFFSGKLGRGQYFFYNQGYSYIMSKEHKNIHLAEVLDYKYNDNYIIAIRLPIDYFWGGCNCDSYAYDKLNYLIIDKHTNTIYETDNINRFQNKLIDMNVNLNFDLKEIQQAYYRYNQNKFKYKNTQSLTYLKIHCKKSFNYPITKY